MKEGPLGESPFEILGVRYEATDEEVRSAYFAQIKAHPPERDPEGFKEVRSAYEKIRTQKSRADFVLSTPHVPPNVEACFGTQRIDGLEPREEDLFAAVLSVTELKRTSFVSDLADLDTLMEEVLEWDKEGDQDGR